MKHKYGIPKPELDDLFKLSAGIPISKKARDRLMKGMRRGNLKIKETKPTLDEIKKDIQELRDSGKI